MANVTSATKGFPTAQEGFTTTTSGSVPSGAATVGLNSVAGYNNGEVVALVIDPTDATKKQVFTGTMDTSGSQVTGVVWTEGTNTTHTAGATVVDYETATAWALNAKFWRIEHNPEGTHKFTQVLDTNSNETLKLGSTASAVNELTITNAATGNGPTISATGGDTNVDINFSPKGTGKLKGVVNNLYNPYKFSAYRNAAWTAATNTVGKVTFDTEDYDTNNNFASGTYTVPVAGFYHFDSMVASGFNNGATGYTTLYKNGAEIKRGQQTSTMGLTGANVGVGFSISATIQCAASDTIEIYHYGNAGTGGTGTTTHFSGFLISAT
jgi:hypothetical protein